jgi:flagellar hook-associated protein 2
METTSSTASIVKTLGTGSGLDTSAIVAALVNAQFAAKNGQLTKQADTLSAQISGVSKLKSAIVGFDAALKALVKSGSLTTQPTSSATNVAGATALAGRSAAGLSARLTVTQLASAQAATTNTAVARTDSFRNGTLNVTIGGTTTALTIGSGDATLDGVAAKINAAGLGLTAAVVTDGGGARLTIKGPSGAANAFTIDGVDDDPAAAGLGLAGLSVGANATGTTIGVPARDATVTLDGASFSRASNSIADLIPGVRLDLKELGSTTLGAAAPTPALGQAVRNVVETFNEILGVLKEQLDPVTGALRSDPAAIALRRALGQLTTTSLATTAAGPRTLAGLGVATARDGSLSVDTARLTQAMVTNPGAIEAMFADGVGASDGGLSAALSAITARATDRNFGLDAGTSRYTKAQGDIGVAKAKAAEAAAAMSDRLIRQFASMDSRVAAYKSQQDFLKQQVDAWNRDS